MKGNNKRKKGQKSQSSGKQYHRSIRMRSLNKDEGALPNSPNKRNPTESCLKIPDTKCATGA